VFVLQRSGKTFSQKLLLARAKKYSESRDKAGHIKTKKEGEKICFVCGWDFSSKDLELLRFLHAECWKEYRKRGILYPMPDNV
jgi:hypothetical protein